MTTKEAVEFLTKKLKKDKAFRHTYKANIAICFVDEYDEWRKKNNGKFTTRKSIIDISNKAADRFLDLWCSK